MAEGAAGAACSAGKAAKLLTLATLPGLAMRGTAASKSRSCLGLQKAEISKLILP